MTNHTPDYPAHSFSPNVFSASHTQHIQRWCRALVRADGWCVGMFPGCALKFRPWPERLWEWPHTRAEMLRPKVPGAPLLLWLSFQALLLVLLSLLLFSSYYYHHLLNSCIRHCVKPLYVHYFIHGGIVLFIPYRKLKCEYYYNYSHFKAKNTEREIK